MDFDNFGILSICGTSPPLAHSDGYDRTDGMLVKSRLFRLQFNHPRVVIQNASIS